MNTNEINGNVNLSIKDLKSEFLQVSELSFVGDIASFNKVIMLIFANNMIAGLVPSDLGDIQTDHNFTDEGSNVSSQGVYEDLLNAIDQVDIKPHDADGPVTQTSTEKARDMSSGISIKPA